MLVEITKCKTHHRVGIFLLICTGDNEVTWCLVYCIKDLEILLMLINIR